MLELIRFQWGVPSIYRTASTRDEFRRVINEWVKAKYRSYPILYLGFHGFRGGIQIGTEHIPVIDLFELAGKGRGRVIHFGACETVKAPKRFFDQFLKMTGFTAVCGFRNEVDWLHSTALEILILDELSKRKVSPRSIRAFQTELQRMAGSLTRHLGFHVWTKSG